MFGQPRPPFGGSTTGFGASMGTPNTITSGFGTNFGNRPTFGNPTTSFGASTAPFGSAASSGTSLFGTQTQQPSGSLFGQPQTSTGFGSTSGGGLFSQAQQSTSTGFGGGGTLTGTTIKYDPTIGSDTITRNGVSTNIRTRIEVITTMKEYENKSLEELRVEDYLANRKGPRQGSALTSFTQTTQPSQQGTGLFGAAPGSSLFATNKQGTETKSLFGSATSTGFGISAAGSLFGTSMPSFAQPTSTASTGFSFAQSAQTQKGNGFSFHTPAKTSQPLFGTTTSQTSSFGAGSGFSFGQGTQQCRGWQNKNYGKDVLLASQPFSLGSPVSAPTASTGGLGSTFQWRLIARRIRRVTEIPSSSPIQSSERLNSNGQTLEHSDALNSKTEALINPPQISDRTADSLLLKMETLLEDKLNHLKENLANPNHPVQSLLNNEMEAMFKDNFNKLDDRLAHNCTNDSGDLSLTLLPKLEILIEENFKKLGDKFLQNSCEQSQLLPPLISKLEGLLKDYHQKLENNVSNSGNENQQVPEDLTQIEGLFKDNLRKVHDVSQQRYEDIISKLDILFENHITKLEDKYLAQRFAAMAVSSPRLGQDSVHLASNEAPVAESSKQIRSVGDQYFNFQYEPDACLVKLDAWFDKKIEKLQEVLSSHTNHPSPNLDQFFNDNTSKIDAHIAMTTEKICKKFLPNCIASAPVENDIGREIEQSTSLEVNESVSRIAEKDKALKILRTLIPEKQHRKLLLWIRKAEENATLQELAESPCEAVHMED